MKPLGIGVTVAVVLANVTGLFLTMAGLPREPWHDMEPARWTQLMYGLGLCCLFLSTVLAGLRTLELESRDREWTSTLEAMRRQ